MSDHKSLDLESSHFSSGQFSVPFNVVVFKYPEYFLGGLLDVVLISLTPLLFNNCV
jgi:hypothetical protein